jgi:hypothetical protein
MRRKIISLSICSVLLIVAAPTPASAVEYPAYNASCDVSDGISTFTAVKRGFYTFTWRTGSTVNGFGLRYLTAGESIGVLNNPSGVNSSTRFGVVSSSSKNFAYITCTS